MTELGVALAVAHLSVKRIQRSESRAPSSCDESTCSVARLVVSRPRASFDAGLLLPRFVSQALSKHPLRSPFELPAHSPSICTLRCNSKIARRLCIIPAKSKLRGWPRSVLAFQRSRRARLPGACVREIVFRLSCAHIRVRVLPSSAPTLSRETSLGSHRSRSRPRALSRAHLFRVYRARLSTITGNTHRLTVHGLREFVSRFDEG